MLTLIIPLAIAVVSSAVAYALTLAPRRGSRRARALARSLGLPLDPANEQRVGAHLASRIRGSLLGAGLALIPGTGHAVASAPPDALDGRLAVASPLLGWIVVGWFWAGGAIGALVAALVAPRGPGGDERRVARGMAVDLEDYLHPLELIGARAVVAVGVGAAAAAWAVGAEGTFRTTLLIPAVACAIAAFATLVLFEIGARRVLARPARTETAHDRAWDDGLRAFTLRQMASAPMSLGLISTIFAGSVLYRGVSRGWPEPWAMVLMNIGWYATMAGLLVSLVLILVAKPQRHFLRRLWPELAARADMPTADTPPADEPEGGTR